MKHYIPNMNTKLGDARAFLAVYQARPGDTGAKSNSSALPSASLNSLIINLSQPVSTLGPVSCVLTAQPRGAAGG